MNFKADLGVGHMVLFFQVEALEMQLKTYCLRLLLGWSYWVSVQVIPL